MVEIIVRSCEDTIMMVTESAPATIDIELVRKVIGNWSEIVGGRWENARSRRDVLCGQRLSTPALSRRTR